MAWQGENFIEFENREEWLAYRQKSLGASEIAAAVGLSPFKTPLDLWKEKTGRTKPKDLSENPNVQFGIKAEEHLRGLFMAEHPEYTIEYHPYRIYFDKDLPIITATLDGELVDINTGKRGVLEIKTADCSKSVKIQEWKEGIPTYYLAQVIQQLSVTGFDFSVLFAKLKYLNGDSTLRSYEFDRADLLSDITWLKEKAEEFWRFVATDKMPPLTL